MVGAVSKLLRSGPWQWLLQRASAVVLALCALLVLGQLLRPELDYHAWRALFDSLAMRLFGTLALLSLVVHGWIGMWTVSTDYLTPRQLGKRAGAVRAAAQAVMLALSAAYLAWGSYILWGA